MVEVENVVLVSLGTDILNNIARFAGYFAGICFGGLVGLGVVITWTRI